MHRLDTVALLHSCFLFSALSRALDHIPNAFALAQACHKNRLAFDTVCLCVCFVVVLVVVVVVVVEGGEEDGGGEDKERLIELFGPKFPSRLLKLNSFIR